MELRFVCTYWGRESLNADAFLDGVLEEGYDGVEINFPADDTFVGSFMRRLVEIRKERPRFLFIAQQVLPAATETAAQYSARMEERLHFLAGLSPDFINAHTGKDHFRFEDNCRILERADAIASGTGVRILHETHRGRFSFHASTLLPYLERFPALELAADLSHWCTVSESLLADQEEALKQIFPRVRHLHARIGQEQAPQVADPFAPEWAAYLRAYEQWWRDILVSAKARGDQSFSICPEAGPAPYMPALPFTRQPIGNQADVNRRMMQHLKQTFSAL
ncbi:MAG: sugar phosphate isomerase/epimerase [Chitinophagaceae bacterium]|nr:MAG: sugar phosphate isomerase/epimerase [Chitinophagaceae bacterium]